MAKKEIIDNPGNYPDGLNRENTICAKIGGAWADRVQRYEIYFLVPTTDEECQERYGVPLSDLIAYGVQKISTGPNYLDAGFDYETDENKKPITTTAKLKANGHAEMQKLADEYKPGQRVTVDTVKVKKADLAALKNQTAIVNECMMLMMSGKLAKKDVPAWLTERGIDPVTVLGA